MVYETTDKSICFFDLNTSMTLFTLVIYHNRACGFVSPQTSPESLQKHAERERESNETAGATQVC